MDLWRRRGGNLIELVLSHNLSHRDATSPTPQLSTAAADHHHQDACFYSSLSPPRLGGRLGTRFIWNQKKLFVALFQNVHLGVDGDHQNQWDLNIGDHLVVETHHRHLLDVVVHQGGLGRGHFHLRTWGQSSRLVSLKMGSRRWWCVVSQHVGKTYVCISEFFQAYFILIRLGRMARTKAWQRPLWTTA